MSSLHQVISSKKCFQSIIIEYYILNLNGDLISFCLNYSGLSGFESKHLDLEESLTVLIDFKKLQELAGVQNKTNPKVCADVENREYQKCGNKCVLSCRYGSSSAGIAVSEAECKKADCFEGCFCKDGFVRNENKCILAESCPIRSDKAIGVEASDDKEISSNSLVKHIFRPNNNNCGSSGCGQVVPVQIVQPTGCGYGGCGSYQYQPVVYQQSGCGSGGCGQPVYHRPSGCGSNGCGGINIHNHNEAINHGGTN